MSKLKEPCEISRIPVDSSNYQLSWVLGVRINCYCGAGGRCWTGSDYKTNIQIKKKNAASPRLTDRHPQPSAVLLSLRWPPGQLENFKKQPQAVSYLGVYFCFGAIYRHFLQENELFHFHLPISARLHILPKKRHCWSLLRSGPAPSCTHCTRQTAATFL